MKKYFAVSLLMLVALLFFAGCPDKKRKNRFFERDGESRILSRWERDTSVSNMKYFALAACCYSDDFYDYYPCTHKQLKIYLSPEQNFIAPYDKVSKGDESSYVFLFPEKTKRSYFQHLTKTPLMFEKPWLLPEDQVEIAVGFADGHIDTVKIKDAAEKSAVEVLEILAAEFEIPDKDKQILMPCAIAADRERGNVKH